MTADVNGATARGDLASGASRSRCARRRNVMQKRTPNGATDVRRASAATSAACPSASNRRSVALQTQVDAADRRARRRHRGDGSDQQHPDGARAGQTSFTLGSGFYRDAGAVERELTASPQHSGADLSAGRLFQRRRHRARGRARGVASYGDAPYGSRCRRLGNEREPMRRLGRAWDEVACVVRRARRQCRCGGWGLDMEETGELDASSG